MRFFSNDARDSADEQPDDERSRAEQAREAATHVTSEPVAVPSQRPPSPWSNTPPAADGTPAAEGVAGTAPDDTDPPPFHEPSPQPTAFGASTVGGAVAASAMANPQNDRRDATDRDSAADTGVGDDVADSSSNRYAGTVTAPDTVPATWSDPEARDGHDPVVDLPLDDQDNSPATGRAGVPTDTDRDRNQDESVTTFDDRARDGEPALKDEGGFDDPKAVDPVTETPLDRSTVDADRRSDQNAAEPTAPDAVVGSAPLKDEGGFDDPKAVEPATGAPIEGDSTPSSGVGTSASEVAAVAVAVPVAAAAGSVAGSSAGPAGSSGGSSGGSSAGTNADKLFDSEDARTFQERWRDVQLRFVDSPKDAAGDAAKLVDEAVEKLTASLRAQREGLSNTTEDTEELRVQLRGYRDVLNRILSL